MATPPNFRISRTGNRWSRTRSTLWRTCWPSSPPRTASSTRTSSRGSCRRFRSVINRFYLTSLSCASIHNVLILRDLLIILLFLIIADMWSILAFISSPGSTLIQNLKYISGFLKLIDKLQYHWQVCNFFNNMYQYRCGVSVYCLVQFYKLESVVAVRM